MVKIYLILETTTLSHKLTVLRGSFIRTLQGDWEEKDKFDTLPDGATLRSGSLLKFLTAKHPPELKLLKIEMAGEMTREHLIRFFDLLFWNHQQLTLHGSHLPLSHHAQANKILKSVIPGMAGGVTFDSPSLVTFSQDFFANDKLPPSQLKSVKLTEMQARHSPQIKSMSPQFKASIYSRVMRDRGLEPDATQQLEVLERIVLETLPTQQALETQVEYMERLLIEASQTETTILVELNQLRATFGEKERGFNTHMQELGSQVETLETLLSQELESNKQLQAEKEMELNAVSQQLRSLFQEEIQALKEEIDDLRDHNQRLSQGQELVIQLEAENHRLRETHRASLEATRLSLAQAQARVEKLEIEHRDLGAANALLRKVSEDSHRDKEATLQVLSQQIEEKEAQLKTVTTQLTNITQSAQTSAQTLQDQIKSMEAENLNIRVQLTQLNDDLARKSPQVSASKTRSQIEKLQSQLLEKEEAFRVLKTHYEQMSHSSDAEIISRLRQQAIVQAQTIARLKADPSDVFTLRSENERLTRQVAVLSGTSSTSGRKDGVEYTRLLGQFKALQAEIEHIKVWKENTLDTVSRFNHFVNHLIQICSYLNDRRSTGTHNYTEDIYLAKRDLTCMINTLISKLQLTP